MKSAAQAYRLLIWKVIPVKSGGARSVESVRSGFSQRKLLRVISAKIAFVVLDQHYIYHPNRKTIL
jgi:hypothetical protein